MAYLITSQCLECDRCQSVCPTGAIQRDGEHYWIDAAACNNCDGDYGVPQCWAGCPTNDGCIPDAATASRYYSGFSDTPTDNYWDSWFATYNQRVSRLRAAKHSEYWQQWFDAYAQKVSKLGQSRQALAGEVGA